MELILEHLGHTFEVVGTIFVAYAALRVHHRVLREHKIDRRVFTTMRLEQILGWFGVALVIIGYFLEIGIL